MLKIVPLGGLGEVGMNTMVVEHAGGSGPAVSIAKDILVAVQDMAVGDKPVQEAPATPKEAPKEPLKGKTS